MDDAHGLPDRRWAFWGAVIGLAGMASYALLMTADTSPPISATLTFLFAGGFALAGAGLYFGVTRRAAPNLGMIAAVANAIAAAELVAMLLVQIAVRTTLAHPPKEMIAIWLGLDVAWDVFGATGTVLLGVALALTPGFSRLLGLAGAVAGAVLLALNLATFPTPPAEAGSIDAGPFVAMWYLLAMVRVLWLTRRKLAAVAATT